MKIPDLITLCERRIANLQMHKTSSEALGDVRQIERIDAELNDTQSTLIQLRTLPE